MADWTPARVAERLRKAVALKATLSQVLPAAEHIMLAPGARGLGTKEGIGVREGEADEDDVVHMAAEALSWLRWLDPEDARIVLTRLEGARWKMISWRFGISRPTADRRWRYALALIAWRMNGHSSPSRPSMRSFLGGRETFLGGTAKTGCG